MLFLSSVSISKNQQSAEFIGKMQKLQDYTALAYQMINMSE
jgi:hypothetical protein